MKILFLTHETSRSGAPLVLLYFLQWLKKCHPEIKTTVVALKGGALNNSFQEASNIFIDLTTNKNAHPTFVQRVKKRVLGRIGLFSKTENRPFSNVQNWVDRDFSIIYANSVATIPIAVSVKIMNPSSKLVVHVHELETVIKILLPNFKNYISSIDSFIAVSSLVKNSLIKNYAIPSQLIQTFYEFTPLQEPMERTEKGYFTIGGAGSVDWRKGTDYFIQAAYIVTQRLTLAPIRWMWMGKIDEFQKTIITDDIRKAGLEEKVKFIGEKDTPQNFFSNLDVFLLPSREDPFPLVAIEAAMNKIPIICFEGATGTSEILKDGGGEIVPYMDVNSMSEAIIEYYQNKEKRVNDGNNAHRLFSKFTPENICPKIFSHLKSL